MSDKEILIGAIDRAKNNEWEPKQLGRCECFDFIENKVDWDLVYSVNDIGVHIHTNDLIFSHDFAKAFWGEELCELEQTHKVKGKGIEKMVNGESRETDVELIWMKIKLPAWKYHLQQMVLEENPLEYLERFLE